RVWFRSTRRHPGARPAFYEASYGPAGETFQGPDDDLARFLTERYRYFTEAQDGSVRYAAVDHEPWTLAPARVDVDRNTLFGANGFERPASDPVRYYSREISVSATSSRRWAEESDR
ncbi:MAG: hypothetical protein ACI8XM_002824, partial [Haloarculaceae archaeon]